MEILERKLKRLLSRLAKSKELTPPQIDALAQERYRAWINEISKIIHENLERGAKEMLAIEGKSIRAFERRNKKRWKQPIDQLKIMVRIAEESAAGLVEEWNKKHLDDPYTFGALNHLCVRSLALTREIICLIEGGFADGALGRWRALHEAAVAACFLAQSNELTAEKFLASFTFKSKNAMAQLNHYAERANLESFEDEDIRAVEIQCRELEHDLVKDWVRIMDGLARR